jgi:hypothetical protein
MAAVQAAAKGPVGRKIAISLARKGVRPIRKLWPVDGLSGSYVPGRTLNDAGQKSSCRKFHQIGWDAIAVIN